MKEIQENGFVAFVKIYMTHEKKQKDVVNQPNPNKK